MSKYKLWRISRKSFHTVALAMFVYIFVLSIVSTMFYDNPQWVFIDQVSGDIVNPFEPESPPDDIQNYSEKFKQFKGYVIVASATETRTHNLRLFALPGQVAQIYRNFTIYIFTNMPCFYEVKIDEQVLERGYSEFQTMVRGSSVYSTMNVAVTLINETNVTLPVFSFSGLQLLDSPWDVLDEGEGPPIVEEIIRFTRGEFTSWVLMRIAIDILFAFLGFVSGVEYAALHADFQGIDQVT